MWEGGGGELGGRPELSMVLFLLLRVHQKVNNKIDEHLWWNIYGNYTVKFIMDFDY
jgi:hypothetical protein